MICPKCEKATNLSEKYDAEYCRHCNEWLASNCDDPTCTFCPERPEKPLMTDVSSALIRVGFTFVALNHDKGQYLPWDEQDHSSFISSLFYLLIHDWQGNFVELVETDSPPSHEYLKVYDNVLEVL